jgi:formylmethanofuran dehydrogenase subunit B
MKRVKRAVIAIVLCAVTASYAKAGDKAVAGLAIGGGTGAVIGQAVGHNVESTVLGAAVGGAIGLIIGNQLGREHVVVHNRYYPVRSHYRQQVYYPHYKPGYKKNKHYYKERWMAPRKHVRHITHSRHSIRHDRPVHHIPRERHYPGNRGSRHQR